MRAVRIGGGLLAAAVLCVLLAPGRAQAQPPKKVDAATKKLMGANGLLLAEVFKLAAEEYAEFLAKYPNHKQATSARYGLAICRYRLEQYAQAAKDVAAVLKDTQFKKRDEALAVLGYCHLAEKEHDKALAVFEQLLAKHPTSGHAEFAAVSRLQALYLLDQAKPAGDACAAFTKKYPKSGHLATVAYYLALSQSSLSAHADAEATLTAFLKNYPTSPYALDAMLLLGQSLESQGKLDPAAEQYRKLSKTAPPDRQAEGYYSLGLVLYKQGKFPGSIKELAVVVTKHPRSAYVAPARFQLGVAQVAAGKIPDARKTLAEVVAKDKTRTLNAQYWLARCDIAEKKYAQARAALDRLAAAKPAPPNPEGLAYDRAVCAAAMDKHQQAAGEFAAFRKQYPKSPLLADATYRHAFCLNKLGKYPESLALCRPLAKGKASALVRSAAELVAENVFLTEKYAEAATLFQQLIKTAKVPADKLRFQLRLGQSACFQNQFDKAIALLKPLAANPKTAADTALREGIFLLGDAMLQVKRYPESATWLTKYVAFGTSRKTEAQYKLALARLRAGQIPAAKSLFNTVKNTAGASPWIVRATFEYGQIVYNEKKAPEATTVLNKVLASKPPADLIPPTMYLLAWIDRDAKKYEPAAQRFGDLAAKHPKHELAPDAAFQKGLCLKEAGKTAPALAALRAYLAAHPAGKQVNLAHELAGICLSGLDRHAEAVKELGALAANKKTATDTVLYELAWAHRKLKQGDLAIKIYRRLPAEQPTSKLVTQTRAELAELLEAGKNYAEAAQLLQKVVADTKAQATTLSVAWYRLGMCNAKLNKHAEAAAAFTKFATQYPKDQNVPSALYQAGVAYAAANKLPQAQNSLAALLTKFPNDKDNAAAHLKLGDIQATANQFAPSAATYSKFLAKYPKSKYAFMARFGLGWAMENQKKYDDARKWYKQVTGPHSGPTAARAQFQIGECYFAEGKFEQAARELMKVEIIYPYPEWSAAALYDAGRAFEQLKRLEDAKNQYALCVKKYKDSGPAALAAKRLKALGG